MKNKIKNFFYGVLFFLCVVTFVCFCYSACTVYNIQSEVKKAAKNDIDNVRNINTASNKDTNGLFLDILEKSNGITGASELTFFFTFIVSVLSFIFMYRNAKLENLIKDLRKDREDITNLLNHTNSLLNHTNRFEHLLSWIESIYNMSMLISNLTITLPHTSSCYVHLPFIGDVDVKYRKSESSEGDNSIFLQIGTLCSLLLLLCDSIKDWLNDKSQRLDYLTIDEEKLLNKYIEDALDELGRSLSNTKRFGNHNLCTIIEDKIQLIGEIKRMIETVDTKSENGK